MARTTDRQQISEALRKANKDAGKWCVTRKTDWRGNAVLSAFDDTGQELTITYSKAGRITHLAHWQPVAGTLDCASRQPIYHRKREHALEVING